MTAEIALTAWTEGGTAAARTAAARKAAATELLKVGLDAFRICCRYQKWFDEFSATVQSKLNILNMEVMAIEKRIELLETNLSDATE